MAERDHARGVGSDQTPADRVNSICGTHGRYADGCLDCHLRAMAAAEYLLDVVSKAQRSFGLPGDWPPSNPPLPGGACPHDRTSRVHCWECFVSDDDAKAQA